MILGIGLLGALVLGGCGTTGPSTAASRGSAATSGPPTAAPSAPVAVTPRPPTPRPTAGGVLPASGREVLAGTYVWDGFAPRVQLTLANGGWLVGHRHDEFFDLFPTNVGPADGPGVGFGRFDRVYGATGPVPMADAEAVVAALESNPAIEVERLGPAELAGLEGLLVDLRVNAAQTAVFDGPAGAFHLDPGWKGRYRFLDVPGGVLLVSVLAPDARFDVGLTLAEPILEAVRLAP
jgi:hypothetical protein